MAATRNVMFSNQIIANVIIAHVGYNPQRQVFIGDRSLTLDYPVLQVCYNATLSSYRANNDISDPLPDAMSLKLSSRGLPILATRYYPKSFS